MFLGPDGGHYRRSNYARRVFRPACDGRYEPAPDRPARLVIADSRIWPGVPVAMWPAAHMLGCRDTDQTDDYAPPRGRGIRAIPEDVPLTCWLPIRPGLTPHGLRHSHKTWMAEDCVGARAAIHPYSPVPLLDELLADFRAQTPPTIEQLTRRATPQQQPTPGEQVCSV